MSLSEEGLHFDIQPDLPLTRMAGASEKGIKRLAGRRHMKYDRPTCRGKGHAPSCSNFRAVRRWIQKAPREVPMCKQVGKDLPGYGRTAPWWCPLLSAGKRKAR